MYPENKEIRDKNLEISQIHHKRKICEIKKLRKIEVSISNAFSYKKIKKIESSLFVRLGSFPFDFPTYASFFYKFFQPTILYGFSTEILKNKSDKIRSDNSNLIITTYFIFSKGYAG